MSKTDHIRQELRQLMRSMDFLSRHPALDKPGREGHRLTEIYQQMGRVWEFLALQCHHRAGWRKLRDGERACKVCGTLQGVNERWLLLSRTGSKVIGSQTRPTTKSILPTRKAATVVKDRVSFHGARLSVEVLNPHKSRLFRKHDISVAADRLVELQESGLICQWDDHTVRDAEQVRDVRADAGRHGRNDHAVELSDGDPLLEDDPRADLRQYDRLEACRRHATVRPQFR